MWPLEYFNPRYWAGRYWPKVGANTVAAAGDDVTTSNAYFRRTATSERVGFARTRASEIAVYRRDVTTGNAER